MRLVYLLNMLSSLNKDIIIIIIRAARLWSFDSLSRLHEDVLSKVRDP